MNVGAIRIKPFSWLKNWQLRRCFALLFIGVPSCGDPLLPKAVDVLTSSISLEVRIDTRELRALSGQHLAMGSRLALGGPADTTQGVSINAVVVRDTNIVALDAAGVLYAKEPGASWIVWSANNVPDSANVKVIVPLQPAALLNDNWVKPTLPQAFVDVRYPTGRTRGLPSGKSWHVAAGGDLQATLDSAQPGDEILLADSAVFIGNFTLPAKSGGTSDWIIVRPETMSVAAGTRMTPAQAVRIPKIFTQNQYAAIKTAPGAHQWRLAGLEVGHAQGAPYNYGIVVIGFGNETSLAQMPSEVVLDRMYIHGSTTDGASRCVALNGRSLAVIDSWLTECHAKGNDSQGIAGWSGSGPFLIENNHIEAAGQAVMFGGSDPLIANVTPSDITIDRNYMYKPMSWANGTWTVKATFELKHARRVLFEGNVLENHWADAQVGYAIVFQAASQDNTAPWTTVRDVTVQNNVIRNSTSGINMLARYNSLITTPTSRIAVLNNLLLDVGRDPVNAALGRTFQLLSDLEDVTLANNTATMSSGYALTSLLFDGSPTLRTVVVDNVFSNSEYGIGGSGTTSGIVSLSAYAPNSIFSGNVVPNQNGSAYPANNYFPAVDSTAAKSLANNADRCTTIAGWVAVEGVPKTSGVDCDALAAKTRNVVDTPL